MSLFINLISVWLLVYYCLKLVRNKIDSSIIWYGLVSLYFYAFPLLLDSLMVLIVGQERWGKVLENNNLFFQENFLNNLTTVSFHALLFNAALLLSYHIITPVKKGCAKFPLYNDKAESRHYFFPWSFYILVSYVGLALFLYYNNIQHITSMAFEWNVNSGSNRVLKLLVNILITISPVFLLRSLYEKKYLFFVVLALPIVLIEYVTSSRALVISAVFYTLYFFVWKSSMHSFKLKDIIKILAFALGFSILLTFFRGADAAAYPLYRDVSYSDLFYCYNNQAALTTDGSNFSRLILTGFYDYDAYDITKKLADYKFHDNWGSLHPTIIGWAYVDMHDFLWVIGLFVGLIIGVCDRLRYKIPVKLNFLFNAFIFSFIAIAVRGSVQYAYASIIYPLFMLIIFYCFKRIKT